MIGLFGASSALDPARASVTPRDAVHREGSLRLYRYRRSEPGSPPASGAGDRPSSPARPPVVLVYSLINRPTVLDLLPDRSVVRSLLAAGNNVFLVDWGHPGALEARLNLDGHLARLGRAVRAAAAICGSPDAMLLGYCLGGTLALALAALEPRLVRGLALLATPVVFRAGGTFAVWATAEGIAPERMAVGRSGNVPGVLLRELLRFADPIGAVRKWFTLAERAADADFVEPFLAQERWAHDCVDFPGRLYADLLRLFYREDRLARGTLVAGGRPARLDGLRLPVLNLVAADDRIVPPAASLPLADLVGAGGRVETLRVEGGHIGMTVGRKARATTHAALARFFAEAARDAAANPRSTP